MKAIKKPAFVALVALAVLSLSFTTIQAGGSGHVASADTQSDTSIRLTLEAGDYEITKDADGLDVIQMEDFHPAISPGDPLLPHQAYDILVPPDAVPSSLKLDVVSTETSVLKGKYDIKPSPPYMAWADGKWLVGWGEGKDIVNGRNRKVYKTDASFPQDYMKLLPYSQMRKWRFTRVDFTPFLYNPVSGKLTLIESITIDISFSRSPDELDEGLMRDKVMDNVAPGVFDNYPEAKGWYEYEEGGYLPSNSTYDYVIITTNAIENPSNTNLDDFVTHKQGRGHSVLVVTEDDFGGLTGQAPNHRAEKIKKWLQDNYSSMGIKYVLLIGDPSPYESGEGDIPMKMCHPERNQSTYATEQTPTDYFYADLTGDWDLDGDGYYGEYLDDTGPGGVDFAVEVYVGRIPVYSADYTSLDNILQKLIDYDNGVEGDISWRKNILLPMGFQYYTGYDGAVLGEQMKDDYLDNSNFNSWRMYQQGNGACGLDSIYGGVNDEEELRGYPNTPNVRARWAADDFGIVCWWGHGNQTLAVVGYDYSPPPEYECDDGLLFQSSYCSYLDDDHPSFTYQCSCTNGYPENSGNLQYSILKQGGVATVSATRVSWFSLIPYGGFDNSATNSGIGYEYVKRLVLGNSAAEALYLAKQEITQDPKASSPLLSNWYDFNLYGEPRTGLYCFASYSDIDHTTYCDYFNDYPDENIVYTYGGGFTEGTYYKIAYYDGDGDRAITDSQQAQSGGYLSSQHTFNPANDAAGDWHVIVCSNSYTPPNTYAEIPGWGYNIIVAHSFYVEEEAIPEFPTALAAIVALALCAGIYLWMRRKAVPSPATTK